MCGKFEWIYEDNLALLHFFREKGKTYHRNRRNYPNLKINIISDFFSEGHHKNNRVTFNHSHILI